MTSFTGAIQRVAFHARGLKGMMGAPDDPPGVLSSFPFAVTFGGRGDFTGGESQPIRGVHTLVCDMHFALRDLGSDTRRMNDYIQAFSNAVMNDTALNGTVDSLNGVTYEFMSFDYSGTYGIRWELDCKIMDGTK